MNTLGISGAMLQYVTHAMGKAVLFSVAGVMIVKFGGLRSISKMGGLATKLPITAALALLGFMQITGIPPSLGLWSEVLIVFGAVGRAQAMSNVAFVLLVIGLLVAIGLSTAYAFITMKRIFFGPSTSEETRGEGLEVKKLILLPIIIVAVVGVLLFFFPQVFIDPLTKFIDPFTKIVSSFVR